MILVRRHTENNLTPADVCHNVARCADGGADGDGDGDGDGDDDGDDDDDDDDADDDDDDADDDDDDDALDSHRVPVALQIYCRSEFNCAMSRWHISSPSG